MNASCSLFSQILTLIPRPDFERIVNETGAEYRSKGLSSRSQFVGMLFCQLGRAHSLREIEGGLKSCEGKLAHLGIDVPVRPSLSYANRHRPWQLVEKVFSRLFEIVAANAVGKKTFRFKHKLVSLDSTVIDLCLSLMALIAMLLLRDLQRSSRFGWSLANLVALLRMNLFTHRDLMAWPNEPFTTPPHQQDYPQMILAFG